uniref:Putative molecular chaperone dnaj superfamily n=1 Tax=Anopheles triannulatus TaxID=58253 RepID=A0A2M4A8L2_9DIPT
MMLRQLLFVKLLVAICLVESTAAHGWGADDMDIFDLVEEVNENFYHVMNISQTATGAEIKRAFRKLSVVLHPDKSDAEDANIQFRNLVSVYEILKDPVKREKYDKVLKDGMPNWRSALYYYRHVRKMGIAESAIILFIVITITQYLVAWAAYVEKKYTAEQIVGSKLKKLSKKKQTNQHLEGLIYEIPQPSIRNTLPFQIPICLWRSITGLPAAIRSLIDMYAQQKKLEEEARDRKQKELEEQVEFENQRAKEKENRTLRKRSKKLTVPEKTDEELAAYSQRILGTDEDARREFNRLPSPVVSGGLWTDDDLNDLVRLVKKYPGGTTNRWDLIAELMNRNVEDVTYMAAKLKEAPNRLIHQSMDNQGAIETVKNKTKTRDPAGVAISEVTSSWTQQQQQALEAAIQRYPKSTSTDRWQKIANNVPGKTKDECIARYKHLVELIKKQKKDLETPLNEASNDSHDSVLHENQQHGTGQMDVTKENIVPAQSYEDECDSIEHPPEPQKAGKSQAKSRRRERKKALAQYSYSDNESEDSSDE